MPINRRGRGDPSSLVTGLAEKLAELETAVSKQSERMAAMVEVGGQISAARDVDQLLHAVMDRLTALLDVETATLFVYDESKRELWSRVIKACKATELRVSVDTGIAGHVFTTGETLVLGDAYADVRFNPDVDLLTGFRTRSVIAVALRHVRGKPLGVLQVLDSTIDAFTAEDRALVEGFALQIAAVLDNVTLIDDLRSERLTLELRVRELDALHEAERILSTLTDENEVIDAMLALAARATHARSSTALYFDAQGRPHVRSGGVAILRRKADRVAPGELLVEEVSRTGAPAVKKGESPKLAVPIPTDGARTGALELRYDGHDFGPDEQRLASALAAQMGRAIALLRSRAIAERLMRLSAIGQALAGVLHDLRTPLTAVVGFSSLIATEEDPKKRSDMAALIARQVELINAMQRETLAFARGERKALKRKVHLNTFFDDIASQIEPEFAAAKVELKVALNFRGVARFDENKIRRAVLNLARNAIEATPSGGHFLLSVDRDGDDLVIGAKDDGAGISSLAGDTIFDSFVTSGKADGTGLGLAMVKEIAEDHNGKVTYRALDKGTAFELRFPLDSTD